MQVQKPALDESRQLITKGINYTPKNCQFFKFTHGWSHFHKKWDDSAYRKHNADGGGRGGGTEGEWPHPEHNLRFSGKTIQTWSRQGCYAKVCRWAFTYLINSLLFPLCNTSLMELRLDAVWGGDWGYKLKGSTFTLSALNGGHGNTKVIYAWGQVTPIC